jgi:hypothetical protein
MRRFASVFTVLALLPVISALFTLTSVVARLFAMVFHAGGYSQLAGGV